MQPSVNDAAKLALNPYMFVLKENDAMQGGLLDYSLQMLEVGGCEVLRSPDVEFFPLFLSNAQVISSQSD